MLKLKIIVLNKPSAIPYTVVEWREAFSGFTRKTYSTHDESSLSIKCYQIIPDLKK